MNVLSLVFSALVSIVLPIGFAVWLSAKQKGYLKPVLFGALTFVVFQMLTRIPLLQLVLPQMPWFTAMSMTQPVLTALFYGCTAALFEEGGRYIIMRLFLKKRQSFADGIAFGVGHGGIEAVLVVGVNAVVNLVLAGSTLTAAMDAGMFAAGAERLFAMTSHIAWSLMVLKSVREKKIRYLLLALLLHALMDTGIGIASGLGLSLLAIEAALGICACGMLLYILFTYKKAKGEQIQ